MDRQTVQLTPFESHAHTRLIFGRQTTERVGELARELGAKRVLLVTDPGLMTAGHGPRVEAILRAAGLTVSVFAKVQENPTTHCVEQCLAIARTEQVDTFIGLGGGSAMDTAKGCNLLLTNGGRMQDYWGIGKAVKPLRPLIAIPTTAGTGSECQSAALITDDATHQKMACLDPQAAPRVAVLDPELTLSQPARVTAVTGLDAIAHAVESTVTRKRNPFSLMYSHQAFTLLAGGFLPVISQPDNLAARAEMQLGAAFAGLAIEHSMLGAAHAAANPLTAHYGIVHGQAVGMMLPEVVRFNAHHPPVQQAYAEMAATAGLVPAGHAPADTIEALVRWLTQFRERAELPASLAECGVEESAIPKLAEEAARQWTAQFNPRPITAQDFAEIYQRTF